MKWNSALVLFFALLLTIRFFMIDAGPQQQRIRIMPLTIERGTLKDNVVDTEIVTFDYASAKHTDVGRKMVKHGPDQKKIIESLTLNDGKPAKPRRNEKRDKSVYTKNEQESEDGGDLVKASMYCSKPFGNEQDEFFPSDKIYISLNFPSLKAGQHNIATHWKTPWGTIARTVVRNIDLEKDVQFYNAHFWFQLVENGMFTQMFTGAEYGRKVYGKWEVQLYLNEEPVVRKHFVIAAM